MKNGNLLLKFLVWRIKNISTRNFVLILSAVIGLIAGLAAVLLKLTVHYIQHLLTGGFNIAFANYFYLGYPLLGLILTVMLAKYIVKEPFGHGITGILFDITKKSSVIRKSKMYSNMIGSAITVGLGGSVGLEAPIVVTGSAIGSNVGRFMHLPSKKRALLIGCGSAGAISAIFNSPIAGVIFCIEVILTDININSFIPLLLASVAGSLVSLTLLGDEVLFSFKLTEPFVAADVFYFFLLGLLCGVVSLFFTKTIYFVEKQFQRARGQIRKAVVGGILLGVCIFFLPPMYGEGYNVIKELLNGRENEILNNSLFSSFAGNPIPVLIFMLAIILVKPIATALTIGSGGNGGIFAPSLFLGGMTGYFFAKVINTTGLFEPISTSNFTLVGMCGVMSGVLHAPLTAIFLIAEITSGYTLFVPLMLVSAIAYSTIYYFEKYSLYTKSLVTKGYIDLYDKDKMLLSQIDIYKLIEKDLLTIQPNTTLGDLVKLVRKSRRNIFPVVNSNKELLGIITLDDIRDIMFDRDSQKTVLVEELMHSPPDKVSSYERMKEVMDKFEKSGAWNLPVIDNGKYVGLVSKSRIFDTYRTILIRQHREE